MSISPVKGKEGSKDEKKKDNDRAISPVKRTESSNNEKKKDNDRAISSVKKKKSSNDEKKKDNGNASVKLSADYNKILLIYQMRRFGHCTQIAFLQFPGS